MTEKTSRLNFDMQIAVRELLILSFDFDGSRWAEFADRLNHGSNDKIKYEALIEMSRTRKIKGIERPKRSISPKFAVRLITFCKSQRGLNVPANLIHRLGDLWKIPDHGILPTPPAKFEGFIPALGITDDVASRSISRFEGKYLQFALNEDAMIVTTKCDLSADCGEDTAPVFTSERWYPDFGSVEAMGVYFVWDTNLYLLASPNGEVDLRLSIFNVLSSNADHKQNILRGMALGVNPKKTILSSRCVLVRSECFEPDTIDNFWNKPLELELFSKMNAHIHGPSVNLRAIAKYLCGEENVDYLKLIKLAAPG